MGRVVRFAHSVVFSAATLLLAAGTMHAQDALPVPDPSTSRFGGPQDWSDQHVIYTRNGSVEDMLKLRDDPRFLNSIVLHYMREHRNQLGQPATAADPQGLEPSAPWHPPQYLPFPNSGSKRRKVDWAVSLGPTAGMAIGETPAVYVYNYATPSCSDFVVYTINAPATTGAPGQANLFALKNLYTNGAGAGFCAGTGPSVLFSYAIGTGGSMLSPVLSLDGTKIAWIENRTATTSYLHITNWLANQGTSAVWPVAVTGTFSNGLCTPAGSSCDDAIQYTASVYPGCPTAYSAGNGHSDLYVDYPTDSGFISANNGLLYHIKNIFSTTTAPSIDFCIPVNSTFEATPTPAMSGPIYDEKLNEVFITDSEKIYSYTVNATAGPNFSPAASYTYGNSASNYSYPTGPGPLLDWFNGFIYVFSTYDANSKTSVTQLPTSLATGVPVELGPISANGNQLLFYGAFDNNYYNNGPANAASTLYSCGTDSTTTTAQDLFAISFNASTGVVNATPAMSYNTNVNPSGTSGLCSPITEFFDGTTDRIFVGMGQPAAVTGANVVTMWNVTTQLTNTSGAGGTMPTPSVTTPTAYLGGTSGISADNNASGTAQAQSIYFSTEEFGTASSSAARAGFNVNGIYTDGTTFNTGGLDNDGNAYSSNLLGATLTWNGTTFTFGTANVADVWANTTITLPGGSFSTLEILGAAVNGNQANQTFTVTYTDNSTTTLTQSVSDWFTPQDYAGESIAKSMAYRDESNGMKDNRTFLLYGYSFGINASKTVKSLTLPATRNVCVLAVALASNCGGKDYCAVKLTQGALQ